MGPSFMCYPVSHDDQPFATRSGHFGCVDPVLVDTKRYARKVAKKECKHALWLSTLNHPNIVSFHDDLSGNDYLMMDWHEMDLEALLKKTTITHEQALFISNEVLKAMFYLRENQVAHNDIALRNVLVDCTTSGLVVKLADFGLATRYGECPPSHESNTVPSNFKKPDWRSDVYSFGLLMQQLFGISAPRQLRVTVLKCLVPEADRRPTLEELATALQATQTGFDYTDTCSGLSIDDSNFSYV